VVIATGAPASTRRLSALLGFVAGTSGLSLAGAPVVTRDVVAALDLAPNQQAWIVAAFSLGLAVTTPLFGRLADLLGGREVMAVGAAATIAGCVLVALAGGLGVLICGRLLQGAGTAGLSIAAFAIPGHRLEGAERARVLGSLTALSALLLGAGPLIGAALAEVGGWRATLCGSALMLVALPWLVRLATPPRAGAVRRPDWTGAAWVLLVAGAIAVALQAGTTGMAPVTVALVALAGIGGAAALAWHVARHPDGFLPLRVLADRRVILPSLAAGALMGGYLAMSFLAPLLLTAQGDPDPLRVGVLLLPAAVAAGLVAHAVGTQDRLGAEAILVVLAVASSAGIAITGAGHAVTALVVLGAAAAACGFAGAQGALLERSAAHAGPGDVGVVTGVFNLIFMLGGAAGSALAGGLVGVASLAATALVVAVLPLLAIPAALRSAAG
jgi:MFS family permease